MTEDVKIYLRQLIKSVKGLHAIILSDRDGVPVLKMADSQASELAMRPSFLNLFSTATDQASKLGVGENKAIIAFYETVQVVQINKHPLLVTFLADADSVTGEITNLELELQDLLDEVKKAVETPQS